MAVVYHAKPHSMSWCLDCHRAPEEYVRPLSEITHLDWEPTRNKGESMADAQKRIGTEIKNREHLNPPVGNCAGCHR